MKKTLCFCLVVLILVLSVSCDFGKTDDPTALFPSGTMIPQQQCNANLFTGTYLLSKDYESYAYVSFDSAGVAVVVPISYYLHPSSETPSYGTWSNSTITILGNSLSITGNTSSNNVKNGFYCKINGYSNWYFTKVSDDLINIDVYSDKSIICGKAWGKTDDYGFTKGYRFNTDGTCIYHSNETGSCYSEPYKVALSKPLITIGDDYTSSLNEMSFVLIGNYLYLGTTAYGCYGATVPIKASITGTTLTINDITGMYVFVDSETGKYGDGYCCLQSSGKYWQVVNGEQKTGSWVFSDETGIRVLIDGEMPSTYSFVAGKDLKLNGTQYPSATRISANENYFYGIYEGSELQIKNSLVGSWWNRDIGLGFTFNSDFTAIIYAFDEENSTWNGLTGLTWSYASGRITIVGSDWSTSIINAKAYGIRGTELYLQQNAYTENP